TPAMHNMLPQPLMP
ncbi:putative 2-aminoethylphosphonate transport system permease protein PhnV, partial [Haemophilus influenzae]